MNLKKTLIKISLNDLQVHNNFVIEILINFFLLLRKGVYPYEYMNSWETFDEELLPEKEAFYSSLNMEGITDVDYRHAKRVYKEFNNKSLGDYHGLYVLDHEKQMHY